MEAEHQQSNKPPPQLDPQPDPEAEQPEELLEAEKPEQVSQEEQPDLPVKEEQKEAQKPELDVKKEEGEEEARQPEPANDWEAMDAEQAGQGGCCSLLLPFTWRRGRSQHETTEHLQSGGGGG